MASQQDDHMDLVEQSLAPFAVVDEVVRAHTSQFTERGFSLTNVTVEGPPEILLRFIVFHFWNARTGLRLEVSSFLGRSGLKRGFNAIISTPDHRTLNVRDYLMRHGRSDIAQLLTNEAPTDVRAFAEASVQMLIGLLDNELKPIVEGETFEETPIDWQGYK